MRIMAAVAKSTVRRWTGQVTAIAEVIDWGKGVQGEQAGIGGHGQWRRTGGHRPTLIGRTMNADRPGPTMDCSIRTAPPSSSFCISFLPDAHTGSIC